MTFARQRDWPGGNQVGYGTPRDTLRDAATDCPEYDFSDRLSSGLNLLTLNGLCAASRYDPDAMRILRSEELSDLVNTIRKVRAV